jgi:hypothetical protein
MTHGWRAFRQHGSWRPIGPASQPPPPPPPDIRNHRRTYTPILYSTGIGFGGLSSYHMTHGWRAFRHHGSWRPIGPAAPPRPPPSPPPPPLPRRPGSWGFWSADKGRAKGQRGASNQAKEALTAWARGGYGPLAGGARGVTKGVRSSDENTWIVGPRDENIEDSHHRMEMSRFPSRQVR